MTRTNAVVIRNDIGGDKRGQELQDKINGWFASRRDNNQGFTLLQMLQSQSDDGIFVTIVYQDEYGSERNEGEDS